MVNNLIFSDNLPGFSLGQDSVRKNGKSIVIATVIQFLTIFNENILDPTLNANNILNVLYHKINFSWALKIFWLRNPNL